jgi:aminoglycoside phosphotransferase (APT) family kinase protein
MTNNPNDRRNEYRDFNREIIANFLGSRTIAAAERISSGKSNTNIKLELSEGETVVARLYSENAQSTPAREKLIADIITKSLGNAVPVPKMLDHGKDWAVFEFAQGKLLESQPEYSKAAAQAAARLTQIHFDTVGWITENGDVAPFDFGDDYFASRLEHKEVRDWLGPERIPVLTKILANENTRLAEIHEQPSLTHGDFNPTNILIHNGQVSAVLDWEYAHAGTPYMDIGNLLRNTDPNHHEAIGEGLKEGGFELPNDWKHRAALIDFSSHLEFLTSTRSDEFKRTRVALIDSFINMFQN